MRRGFWRNGDPWVWLTGGALAISLLLVIGLVGLVMVNGLGFFWPSDVARLKLIDGTTVLGEMVDREKIPDPDAPDAAVVYRVKVKQGNRQVNRGEDFLWVDEAKIAGRETPDDAVVAERREWGNLYGVIKEVREDGKVVAQGPADGLVALEARLPRAREIFDRIKAIEEDDIGEVNYEMERIELARRRLERSGVKKGPEVEKLDAARAELQKTFETLAAKRDELRATLTSTVVFSLEGGREKVVPVSQVVRITAPNTMGMFSKIGHYFGKVWEFVSDDPREANTEGGVFPAIFGTVMMVFIMSFFVTPLGVMAALYLREYAKQGPVVSAVRIAVNNLAGVPSIVFGVFGVGFFIYMIGSNIDEFFFSDRLPTPTYGTPGILWASLTLSLLTVPVVIVAAEEGLAAIPRGMREASLALGATKFETTWRVVLPALAPSILTGIILAMARAAGEVAPLMITGVVKHAQSLPLDGYPPYVHLDRKFMHLGFHIYDVGFQSPNVEAARPMVFTTTLLLLGIVVLLNLTAIVLRKRLQKKVAMSAL